MEGLNVQAKARWLHSKIDAKDNSNSFNVYGKKKCHKEKPLQ